MARSTAAGISPRIATRIGETSGSLNQAATYPRRSPIQYNGLANGVHLSRVKFSCCALE
jgi:hypothetical protein